MQQYTANTTNAQKFRFIGNGDGSYRILSALSSSQVWDVAGVSKANGAKVQTYAWKSGSNQKWIVQNSSTSGYVTFKPQHSTSQCLDVPGGSKSTGKQLQIYSCNSTSSQQYSLSKVGVVSTISGRLRVPFVVGQAWYVCQGYNGAPSHRNDPALDVTTDTARGKDGCYGNASAAAGKIVYAPASGSLAQVSNEQGAVCITMSSGGSVLLAHLGSRRANGAVKAGESIGKVAAANQAGNGGYAHVHLSARTGSGCNGTKVPFDDAHNMRFQCVGNLTSNGSANQWAGTKLQRCA